LNGGEGDDVNRVTRSRACRIVVRIFWVLCELTTSSAVFLDIVYWALLYRDDGHGIGLLNINHHGLNAVIALVDFTLTRQSWIPIHFLFEFLYVLLYCFFAWTWYAITGKWIYFILDWHELIAVAYYSLIPVGCAIIYFSLVCM
jgi:hypothetical protein